MNNLCFVKSPVSYRSLFRIAHTFPSSPLDIVSHTESLPSLIHTWVQRGDKIFPSPKIIDELVPDINPELYFFILGLESCIDLQKNLFLREKTLSHIKNTLKLTSSNNPEWKMEVNDVFSISQYLDLALLTNQQQLYSVLNSLSGEYGNTGYVQICLETFFNLSRTRHHIMQKNHAIQEDNVSDNLNLVDPESL